METFRMADGNLIVEIKNTSPIELADFTSSFYALGQQYNRHLQLEAGKVSPEAKLYIREIRSGSIIAELVDKIPMLIPFVENSNTIITFVEKIGKVTKWLLGKSEKPAAGAEVNDLKELSRFVNPVATDGGGQMIITGNSGHVNVAVYINSVEANAIQNSASREIARIQAPNGVVYDKVLFYWDTTRYDIKSTSVDKGVIQSISSKPLKVVFNTEDIKRKMIDTEGNFFHLAFIVDAEVQSVGDQAMVYKILNVYDSIERLDFPGSKA